MDRSVNNGKQVKTHAGLVLNTDPTPPTPGASNAGLDQAASKPSYVWGVDLIRFAAAVMVVFFHLSWKSKAPSIAFPAGWVGVEIFFVISGFVIMGSASTATVATFARKRFARLYPAAIVCALINLAVLIPFSDLANSYGLAVSATPAAFLASLLLIKGPFLVGALWTLPIEIGFYVLIAAMISCGWVKRPIPIAAGLILWSSLYLIPFCLSQYGHLQSSVQSLEYGLLNLSMLRHGCFFGVGILLWLSVNRGIGPNRIMHHYALLSLGIVLCWVEIFARVAELRGAYAYFVDAGMLAVSTLSTFSFAAFAMWLLSRLNDILRPGRATRSVLRTLGLVTYPLYLLHEGVGGVVFGLLQANGYDQGLALLAGFASALATAWVVVIALEPWLEPKLTTMVRSTLTGLRMIARAGRAA